GPAMEDMNPHTSAGTFIDFHCFSKMPLWGMSKTGRINCALSILALLRPAEKSEEPVGYASAPTVSHPSFSVEILDVNSPVSLAHSTSWFITKSLLNPNSAFIMPNVLTRYPTRCWEFKVRR